MNIKNWLEEIGLSKYSDLFESKGITLDSLSKITSTNELKEIGIKSSIVRDKILFEISNIDHTTSIGAPPSSPYGKTFDSNRQVTSSTHQKSKVDDIPRIHPLPKKVLNEYEEAIIQNKKELKIKINELGGEHEDVGDCYYELGTNYYMNEQYEEAIANHKKSLAIRIKCYGEDDVDVVISYYQLGNDYYMNSDYKQAITNHMQALKLQIELNEDDDNNEGVGAISFDLAKDYYYDCQYDKAIKYHEKALEIRRYIFGNVHNNVAEVYYNLGLVYQQKLQYTEALSNFDSALSIYIETNGEYSEDATKIEDIIDDINYILRDSEKTDTKTPSTKKTSNSIEDVINNIKQAISEGDLCIELDEYEDAITHYKNALNLCDEINDSDIKEDNKANINFKLGTTTKILEEYSIAEDFLKEAISGYMKVHGTHNFYSAVSYSQLGDTYYHMEDYENAIINHRKALVSYTKIDNEELASWSHYDLGLDFFWTEDYEQSCDHFHQALDIKLKLYGLENESVAKCYNRLGLSYYWDNKLDLALKNHKIALEIRNNLFGRDSDEFDDSRFYIGQTYYYAGQIRIAKEHLEESLKYRENKFGSNSNEYKKAKEWLDKIKSN